MAAMESASSCGPQANSQPPPPRAQAPKPTRVIWMSEFPNFRVSIRNLFLRRAIGERSSQRIWLFYFFKLDEHTAKRLDGVRGIRRTARLPDKNRDKRQAGPPFE